jgi:hypothetical protein
MRRRPAVGDVIQITLPNGSYAYGRVLLDSAVAFYRGTTTTPGQPPIGSRDYQFVVGVYDDVVKSDRCPVVGHDPSRDEDDSWPPPSSIRDVITGRMQLYVRGVIRQATVEECEGLEPAAAWGYQHIVDRLYPEGRDTEPMRSHGTQATASPDSETINRMDRASFWKLIDDAMGASGGNQNVLEQRLRSALMTLGAKACLAFDATLGDLMVEAYTWDLWAAAHVINGGCSDDGFVYFRCWLIAQGESAYTHAVRDPDSLADIVDPSQDDDSHEYEDLLYIGRSCFEELTDVNFPSEYVAPGAIEPVAPRGERWQEDDLARRLPRLAEMYGWQA